MRDLHIGVVVVECQLLWRLKMMNIIRLVLEDLIVLHFVMVYQKTLQVIWQEHNVEIGKLKKQVNITMVVD